MIKFKTILLAKSGDEDSIAEILQHYLKIIKKYSTDDEFVQMAQIAVYRGIYSFKNIKK